MTSVNLGGLNDSKVTSKEGELFATSGGKLVATDVSIAFDCIICYHLCFVNGSRGCRNVDLTQMSFISCSFGEARLGNQRVFDNGTPQLRIVTIGHICEEK